MDDYIRELFDKIKKTEVRENNNTLTYKDGIDKLVDLISEKKRSGAKVYFIGNGGSAAIASHMTADYMKNGGMNTCSLYDNAVTTCMGNDYGYQDVFARPLEFLSGEGDLIVAISSSGRSANIIKAIEAAKKNKADIITFTGFESDNPVSKMGTINVFVPCKQYGMVESIHNLILQEIVDIIMERDGVRL